MISSSTVHAKNQMKWTKLERSLDLPSSSKDSKQWEKRKKVLVIERAFYQISSMFVKSNHVLIMEANLGRFIANAEHLSRTLTKSVIGPSSYENSFFPTWILIYDYVHQLAKAQPFRISLKHKSIPLVRYFRKYHILLPMIF